MDKTYYIAVDLGATSGRVILASFDGTKVETEELHRFRHPILPIAGHLFWNLPGLYAEILTGLKAAAKRLEALGTKAQSIGIDTWGCDVAYFNADGSLAGLPYCYRDPHTEGAVERYCQEMPRREVYARTGIQFMDFNTLFQLHTLSKAQGNSLAHADKILFMPDALSYMLTGHAVTERTVASTAQFLNPATGELDSDLLAKAGLTPQRFGTLVNPGHIVGTLTEAVQKATGLGAVPVVAVAGHDTASAVIGVPARTPNFAYLSCGTWSLLGIESDKPIISDKTYEYNFTNEGGLDGTVRFLKNICGMWLFERSRAEFGPDAPQGVAELCALYTESDIDSIINPDDPVFANPVSMTEAISDYCARTGQRVPQVPADYIRVIFRSLAARYAEVLTWLRELSPRPVEVLHVIGGGSQNGYLMQLTADALGIPVVAGPTESTALGNVLVQLRADGLVSDLDQMRKVADASVETKTYLPQ